MPYAVQAIHWRNGHIIGITLEGGRSLGRTALQDCELWLIIASLKGERQHRLRLNHKSQITRIEEIRELTDSEIFRLEID